MIASDIVNGALRLIGALASGETPSSDEAADGLAALQQLLASWSGEELLVFATRTATITLAATTVSYAIPGARPVKILSADLTVSGINAPVEVCGPERWAEVPDKGSTSPQPRYLYCDYAYPTPAVVVAPIPSAVGSLNLFCMVDLATLAASGSTFDMPEGYARALRFNLALDLAGEFGRTVGEAVMKEAVESKAQVRRMNAANRAGKSELVTPPLDKAA